ncbi:PEP-CTERM sorting domain-containing protein [Verrucomicrobiaceae bacterium N1E253]|uniref:PEP-CTERM sorting domain-containing protein n=1 Tax=Oceaniferula marina TaxID=2748318 RepID=A0A851GJX9_9BACT|nr:LamG-like jellyroll fold domain-containing protein [Oceaniferula marina]NWK54474.1 PEP-CTERM sorting domain-containing protein [Oceaniferula marina]
MKKTIISLGAFSLFTLGGQAALIAEYTFENGTFTGAGAGMTINDQSGNNYTGTISGGGLTGTTVVVDGERGNVINVTSESGGTMSVGIDSNTGERTYAFWLKTTDHNGYVFDNQSPRNIAGMGNGSSSSNSYLDYYDGTAWRTSSVGVNVDNAWHHYAYVLSGTTATFYVDGSEAGSVTISDVDALSSSQTQMFFGRYSASAGIKTGSWDDVQLYDNALTAQEVAALAAVPEPTSTALIGLGGLSLILRRRR